MKRFGFLVAIVGLIGLASVTVPAQTAVIDGAVVGIWNALTESVYLGLGAGQHYPDGIGNTALGNKALYETLPGDVGDNTAIGVNALVSNRGGYNTTVGADASVQNTTGTYNVAIGKVAQYTNQTSSENVAVGHAALYSASAGPNTAVGGANTGSVLGLTTTGAYNVGVGDGALWSNTTGIGNTGLGGGRALGLLASGDNNVAVGQSAGFQLMTGSNNTLLGAQTGATTLQFGNRNILIGYGADTPATVTSDYLNIGGVITGNLATGVIHIPSLKVGAGASCSGTVTILAVVDGIVTACASTP